MLTKFDKIILEMTQQGNLYCFDFDDTLATSDSKVIVIKKDGERQELSAADFNNYKPEVGDKIDFDQFRSLINP